MNDDTFQNDGEEYEFQITAEDLALLIDASVIVIDQGFDTLREMQTRYIRDTLKTRRIVRKGMVVIPKAITMSEHEWWYDYLPPQFQHHYTPIFIQQMLISAAQVSYRLANWNGGLVAANTAEALMLRAFTREAITTQEVRLAAAAEEGADVLDNDIVENILDSLEERFENFLDVAVPDTDYEILFDSSMDGFENDQIATDMDMLIRLEDWFKPVYELPSHPYAVDGDQSYLAQEEAAPSDE